MYAKYTTEAVVLGGKEQGDADKTFFLYTRDFGLLYARAVGIRKESSLMRYALTTGADVTTSLIKGKAGWRLAGATATGDILNGRKAMVFGRIARLLTRLVRGEEENEYLYNTLRELRGTLLISDDVSLSTIELLAVARILFALGYLSQEALGTALFAGTVISSADLASVEKERTALLGAVNTALSASQL